MNGNQGSRPISLKCRQRGQSQLVRASSPVPSVTVDPPLETENLNGSNSKTPVNNQAHLSPAATPKIVKDRSPLSHLKKNQSTDSIDSGCHSQTSSQTSLPSAQSCRTSQDISNSNLIENSPVVENLILSGQEASANLITNQSSTVTSPVERPERVSLSVDILAELLTAAMKVTDDIRPAVEKIEIDGPYRRSQTLSDSRRRSSNHLAVGRRLSADSKGSAREYVPVQRRRSTQPFFHSFVDIQVSPSKSSRSRKTSGCIICDRKHDKQSSAPSVIIKTAMSRKTGQRRRFSEALQVLRKSECDLPYVELQVLNLDELEILRKLHKRILPRKISKISQARLTKEVSSREEIIKKCVTDNLPEFVRYINWTAIMSYLVSKRLLSNDCRQALLSHPTDTEKGNYFYLDVLPTLGDDAYCRFYECLKGEQEHHGHSDLWRRIDEAFAVTHTP